MNDAKLAAAISEAERFIKKARAARKRLKEDRLVIISGSAETGAARRASMDLTRALADLRKSSW
jgi:hypothetical protein